MIDFMNYITVGRRIHLVRKLKNISLKDFSKMTGLSHTNIHQIENDEVHSKHETLSKLLETLETDFVFDSNLESMFDSIYQKIYALILYYDYAKAVERAQPLVKNESFFLNSTRFLEYHLIMLMVNVFTYYQRSKIDYYYNVCSIMDPFYGDERREWFNLMKAAYLQKKNKNDHALSFIKDAIPGIKNTNYIAMLHYFKGIVLLNDYTQYNAVLENMNLSQKLFEENSIFRRSNHVKAVKQKAYINLYRFDDFLLSFEQSLSYAKPKGDYELFYFVHLNKAIYHNVKG